MSDHQEDVPYSKAEATSDELGRLSLKFASDKVTWACPRCKHRQTDEIRIEVPFVTDADFKRAERVEMQRIGLPLPRVLDEGKIDLICRCDSSHGREGSTGCGFAARQLVKVKK